MDMEMAEAVQAAEVQAEASEQQVVLEQLEQSSFTGDLPDPEDLPHKMYAIIKDGIVLGFDWAKSDDPSLDFVLMTYDNSPAYVQGRYENGKFYEPER